MKVVILAGGGGTRLWPMSRTQKAKQFNAVIGEKTLLELTLDRFKKDFLPQDLFISTTKENLENVLQILPDFNQKNIILEPERRDTAAAMGYVATVLYLKDPDEPLAFMASDHYIQEEKKFIRTLKMAEKEIKKTGKLLDIGIAPEYPSTALGYTKIGKLVKDEKGIELYEFLGHKEKPPYKLAKEYLRDGHYLWHGNFYMWTPRLFLKAFQKYAPEISIFLEKILILLKAGEKKNLDKIKKIYAKIPKAMIDCVLTEKMSAGDILILKGEFGWSDVGNWSDLHKKLLRKGDSSGNLVKGDWVGMDTTQSLIYSQKNKLVVTIGVDDMVVVDTPEALLVCPKGRAQDVKKIVEKLKDKKMQKYL